MSIYRRALALRRELQRGEAFLWADGTSEDVVLFSRHEGWHSLTNFGGGPVDLPTGARVLASSEPLHDTLAGVTEVPGETTVWFSLT